MSVDPKQRTIEQVIKKELLAVDRALGPCPPRGPGRMLWNGRAAAYRGDILRALSYFAECTDEPVATLDHAGPEPATSCFAASPEEDFHAVPHEPSFLEELGLCE